MEDVSVNQNQLDKSLEKKTCIDGFVVISRNLNFYTKPIGSVHVQLPLLVFSSPSRRFKSCKLLNQFNFTHSIKIASVLQSDLLVVFSSNQKVINYSGLLSKVTKCLEEALNGLKGTKTKSAWSSSLLKQHHHRNDVIVYSEDIRNFGRLFWGSLNRTVMEMEELESVYIVLFGMGQSCSVEVGNSLMYHIDTSEAAEFVLHVARDVVLKSHALMWNREIIDSFSFGRVSYEYYPLAIPAAGNFYIPVSSSSEYGPQVRMVKLYGEAYKYVHKEIKCTPPFKQASIAGSLFKAMLNPKRPSKPVQNAVHMMKSQCGIVQAASYDILQKSELAIRAELIISTLFPRSTCFEDSLGTALQFIEQHGLVHVKNMLIFELEVIHQRIEDFVFPCLKTIEESLNRRISSLLSDTYTVQYSEISAVAAAECVLCFMLYGSSFSTRTERRHSNELAVDLNCSPRLYNKRSSSVLPNINIDIFTGTVIYACRSGRTLESILGPGGNIWHGLDICLCVKTICEGKFDEVSLTVLCKQIGKAIFTSCVTEDTASVQPLRHTHSLLLRYPRHRFLSAKAFVFEIQAMKDWDNKRVRSLLQFIENLMQFYEISNESRETFFCHLVEGIERILWEEMEYAVYPTRVGFSLIVVPIIHLTQHIHTVLFNPYVDLLYKVYLQFGKSLLQVGGAKVAIRELLVQIGKSTDMQNIRVNKLLNMAQRLLVGQPFSTKELFKD